MLKNEERRLASQLDAIRKATAALDTNAENAIAVEAEQEPLHKRTMSAAARRAISRRMKQYHRAKRNADASK